MRCSTRRSSPVPLELDGAEVRVEDDPPQHRLALRDPRLVDGGHGAEVLRDRRGRSVGRDDRRADPIGRSSRLVVVSTTASKRQLQSGSLVGGIRASRGHTALGTSAGRLRRRARRASGNAEPVGDRSLTSISFHASRSTGTSSARWRLPPWRAISSTCALKMFFDGARRALHEALRVGVADPAVEADRASVVDVARQDHDGRVGGEAGEQGLEAGLVRRPPLAVVLLGATFDAVVAPGGLLRIVEIARREPRDLADVSIVLEVDDELRQRLAQLLDDRRAEDGHRRDDDQAPRSCRCSDAPEAARRG